MSMNKIVSQSLQLEKVFYVLQIDSSSEDGIACEEQSTKMSSNKEVDR